MPCHYLALQTESCAVAFRNMTRIYAGVCMLFSPVTIRQVTIVPALGSQQSSRQVLDFALVGLHRGLACSAVCSACTQLVPILPADRSVHAQRRFLREDTSDCAAWCSMVASHTCTRSVNIDCELSSEAFRSLDAVK